MSKQEPVTRIMSHTNQYIEVLTMLVMISAIKEFTICAPSDESPSGHYLIFIGEEPQQEIITCFSDRELKQFLDAYLMGWQESIRKYQHQKPVVLELDSEGGEVIQLRNEADEVVAEVPDDTTLLAGGWLQLWSWRPEIETLRNISFELQSHEFDVLYVRPGSAEEVPQLIVNGTRCVFKVSGIVKFMALGSAELGIWLSPLGDLMALGKMYVRTRLSHKEAEKIEHTVLKRLVSGIIERGRTVEIELESGGEGVADIFINQHRATYNLEPAGARLNCTGLDQYWEVTNYMQWNYTYKTGKLSLEAAAKEVKDVLDADSAAIDETK